MCGWGSLFLGVTSIGMGLLNLGHMMMTFPRLSYLCSSMVWWSTTIFPM